MESDTNEGGVKTTRTAFRIIELLRERDGARMNELAEELEKANSTVHRHLSTLEDLEYVVNRDGEYRLGLKFLELGEYTRSYRAAYRLANEKIKELSEETEERVSFVVEEHGYGVFLNIEMGEQAIQTDRGIGKRMYLHATASGKAILSSLPRSRVEEIVERRGLPKATANTITDEEELFQEIEQIQKQGYSLNDQENVTGLRAVAVPVEDVNQYPIGALLISGPIHRFQGEYYQEELPDLLMEAANELELEQAYASDMESVEES